MADNPAAEGTLLWIVELGGYPNFRPLYEALGYSVEIATSGRKALAFLKKHRPRAVIAEFHFQPDFRDRTSNLESILAVLQCIKNTRIVVFYEKEYEEALEKLRVRFPIFAALSYPIDRKELQARLS